MSVTRRLAWSLVSGLLLSSLFGAYSGYVSQWLEVPQRETPLSSTVENSPSGPPPENAIWARRYLPEWAVTARWQGRWGQTYFFAGRQEAIQEDATVRCAPFALVHVPDSDAATEPGTAGRTPVVILADSAVVHFPVSVDLEDPDPRMAVGCRLDGAVEVTGADGLRIRGGNFQFDREAMLVASTDPVQLAWSGHTGRADGVEVHLGEHQGGSQPSRPVGLSAGPVRAVRLLRHVELKMALSKQDGGGDSPARSRPWQIECDGPMVVDPVNLVATLSNSVRVRRPAELGRWDSLECQRLVLQFRRRDGVSADKVRQREQVGQESLEFVQLKASGAPVQIGSADNDLKAQGGWLVYRADVGTIELQGDVVAQSESGRLVSQHVLLSRGSDGRIQRASCQGAGTMTWQQPGTPPVLLSASWSQRMTVSPEPATDRDLVVLEGKPLVRYGDESVLTADSIRIWLARGGATADSDARTQEARIKRLIARDKVGVHTPTAFVYTGLLDVTFEPIATRKNHQKSPRRPGETSKPPDSTNLPPPGKTAQRVEFWAESIRGRLGVPVKGGELVLREVVTEGRVGLSRPAQGQDDPVEITGERVRIVETDGDGHGVTIVGRPATLRSGGHEINGPSIELDSGSGRGSVEGSGTLSMPSRKLLSGDPAPPGTRLKVRWDERLVLNGKTFAFLGGVKSELGDSRVDCEQLEVTLDRAPELSIDATMWRDIELKSLLFRHSVRLTRYTFDQASGSSAEVSPATGSQPRLSEMLKARLANLRVDMDTRDTTADGPGWIQVWRRGRRRQGPLAPIALARANLPLELDAADWQYLRIDFARASQGNIDRGFATFDDQVQVVSGHVSRPGDIIDPDRLGRDAGWIQCDSLQVTREPVSTDESDVGTRRSESTALVTPVSGTSIQPARRTLTLQARGDATGAGRVSGQSWYGRAETISFNEASGRVVLSSLGSQQATLWRRTAENVPFSRVDAQRLMMSLRTGELVLDRAAATKLVPGGP